MYILISFLRFKDISFTLVSSISGIRVKICKHGSPFATMGFTFMVDKRIVSLRRHILVPTTYVIVENIQSVYTDFFVFQRYKLHSGIIRFLESM